MSVHRHFPSRQPALRVWLCLGVLLGTLGAELSHSHGVAAAPPAEEGRRQHACRSSDAHRWSPADASSVRAPANRACTACRYNGRSLQPTDTFPLNPAPPGAALLSQLQSSARVSSISGLGFLDRAPPA